AYIRARRTHPVASVLQDPSQQNNQSSHPSPHPIMIASMETLSICFGLFILSAQGSLLQEAMEEGSSSACPRLDSIPNFDLNK
ncbi:Uncharacterized protein FKW44_012690, partial [Caligus rogercresseyi]